MRVLIVDDQKSVREELREMIRGLPLPEACRVAEASSARQAREMLGEGDVDAVLLDIVMDDEDGFSVLRFVRENRLGASVIMMTGFPQMDFALRAIDLRADAFLVKPVTAPKLQDALLSVAAHTHQPPDRDSAAYQLQCMMLDAYLRDQCLDVDFQRVSENTGLSQLAGEKLAAVIVETPLSAMSAPGRERLWRSIREISSGCVCYSPSVNRVVVLAGAGDGEALLRELERALGGACGNYAAGCAIRPRSAGAAAVYRMADFALESAREMKLTGRILCVEEERMADALAGCFAGRIEAARGNPEELGEALKAMSDACAQYGVPAPQIAPALARHGIEMSVPGESMTMLGLRRALLEAYGARPEGQVPDKVRVMMDYIQAHYRENITLTAVANAADVNYTYASMLFRQYAGASFTEYLLSIRMRMAERLLTQTNCYTYEVGAKVGIPDDKYFIRQFKATHAMTPQAYRSRFGGKRG